MTASVPLDWQIHDTFFVVAHLHYVLIGGSVFPLLGSIHYWWPKMTGRILSEPLGKVGFWFVLVGFNLTFFPMHILGLHGMPRRVYTYPAETGWASLNQLATLGAVILGDWPLDLPGEYHRELHERLARGGKPMGRGHARMVDPFTGSRLQLYAHSDRGEPVSVMGPVGPDAGGQRLVSHLSRKPRHNCS